MTSLEVLVDRYKTLDYLSEMELSSLRDLGHPQALAALEFLGDEDEWVATEAKYTVALLNGEVE